ncbi:hypothetical protein AAFF_G00345010 [Aldrovandia affinis]|uniref:Uncharacterized protein n=1 Tax=Aldrovandia affinis TaxID=143900 RepID=A0AAD7R6A6_9TELE|nr:hypothetical protein AAFF_G00345010 [Aldrovandia affinis]
MLRHFIKRELLHDISPLQLVKLDVSDKKNWVHPTEVKIGLGAESVLKELQRKKGMSKIIQKVQEKSPLTYATVRQVACLDPKTMYTDPDWCQARMSSLVQRFLQDQQLSGGVSAGRRE